LQTDLGSNDAEAYLCGPTPFMEEISAGLAAIGVDASHIHTEPFGPVPGLTPGIGPTTARAPHPPAGQPGTGPTIEFARDRSAACRGRGRFMGRDLGVANERGRVWQ
jgi:ferredoxin-NADP reductase